MTDEKLELSSKIKAVVFREMLKDMEILGFKNNAIEFAQKY